MVVIRFYLVTTHQLVTSSGRACVLFRTRYVDAGASGGALPRWCVV